MKWLILSLDATIHPLQLTSSEAKIYQSGSLLLFLIILLISTITGEDLVQLIGFDALLSLVSCHGSYFSNGSAKAGQPGYPSL